MVCCSMASCMVDRSCSLILSKPKFKLVPFERLKQEKQNHLGVDSFVHQWKHHFLSHAAKIFQWLNFGDPIYAHGTVFSSSWIRLGGYEKHKNARILLRTDS